MTNLLGQSIERMLAVKELPQGDAGRVQAKNTTRIGVKPNGSVVKFLPEDNPGVAYEFVTIGIILLPWTPGAGCSAALADALWKRLQLNVGARTALYQFAFKMDDPAFGRVPGRQRGVDSAASSKDAGALGVRRGER